MNAKNNDWPILDLDRIELLISLALHEDLNGLGDATSVAVVPDEMRAEASLVAREQCVCAGLEVAERVFKRLDEDAVWKPELEDGEQAEPGAKLATVSGKARALLSAERTALNFLQRLCGVATTARRYTEPLGDSSTIILDTRKTTPGWRNLEKYAVAVGGAGNHRIGLYDRVMIKDNHRELAGLLSENGIEMSVSKAREVFPELEVEVEADTLDEFRRALDAGADYILLDNMTDEEMAEAIEINAGRSKLEASGGITLERIAKLADLGLDFISSGALTHSVKAVDISMEISPQK